MSNIKLNGRKGKAKNAATGGGNKAKGRKRGENVNGRDLSFKDDQFQQYAMIVSLEGSCNCRCYCFELDEIRMGHIRGAFRKKVWIRIGDIVLVSFREFAESKTCDIIHQYTSDEASRLQGYEEISSDFNLSLTEHEISEGLYRRKKSDESSEDIRFG